MGTSMRRDKRRQVYDFRAEEEMLWDETKQVETIEDERLMSIEVRVSFPSLLPCSFPFFFPPPFFFIFSIHSSSSPWSPALGPGPGQEFPYLKGPPQKPAKARRKNKNKRRLKPCEMKQALESAFHMS